MFEFLEIKGGKPLNGIVQISGAKNAALPLMMATLLTSQNVVIRNVPNLEDVNITIGLLEHFGAEVTFHGHEIRTRTPKLISTEASYSLVKALRASFWVLGPVLARGKSAQVALPGGDAIGTRPVDLHLMGLTKMGAEIKLKHGVVYASAPAGLKPSEIEFGFPSVGATHQIMMAAALTPGTTVIRGAAREPEIVAMAELLNAMGAEIEGAGENTILIRGQSELGSAEVNLIGDRVEAATYLLAGLASGGSICAKGIAPAHFGSFTEVLSQMGARLEFGADYVALKFSGRIEPVRVSTQPFPGLATDFQAPLMAALCLADGVSEIEENVFEGRFGHVPELCRMGASIQVQERTAVIHGVERLSGAPVEGGDIRGAAALVLAGLCAEGVTRIYEHHHLSRGYESLEQKLSAIGAEVAYRMGEVDDYPSTGC